MVRLLCLGFLVLCAWSQTKAYGQSLDSQLAGILNQQAAAWNRGDIEGFMKAYWNNEKLTFSSGGKTERGWQATRARYFERYPSREKMGRLVFSDLEVQSLGADAALMLGKWKLDRSSPIEGNFSLVWRKFDSAWLIVHDHTSVR